MSLKSGTFDMFEDSGSSRKGSAYSDVDDDSLGPYDPVKTTTVYHIHQAEEAMNTLKQVFRDPNWRKVHSYRTVTVWTKPGVTKDDKIPLFKGEGIIRGFAPQSIFAVISMRALWDEWYEEGNLIENLNETTSLTYMVMKALSGSKTRDLSLVEKIECTPTGTIYFVSTSVDTPKVPRVAGKVRAKLKLNGWILEPLTVNPPSSRVTYILQTSVGGWFPTLLVNKFMSKRPLVIYSIDQYLQRNGPPPMVLNTAPPPAQQRPSLRNLSRSPSRVESVRLPSTNGYPLEHELRRNTSSHEVAVRGIESIPTVQLENIHPTSPTSPTIEKQSVLEKTDGEDVASSVKRTIPETTVEQPQSVPTLRRMPSTMNNSLGRYSAFQHPHGDVIRKALGATKNICASLDGWQFYSENRGIKIYTRESPGKSMPIIRGEGTITGGWTVEDIHGVIMCLDMRKLWDDRYDDGEIIKYFGNDDVLLRTSMKGTFPISGRDVACVMTTERNDATGAIWAVSTSVVDEAVPENRKYVRASLGLASWYFHPHIDESGFTTSVDVMYVVDIDIKLDSIPSSILKTLSMGTPMCVAKVDEVLQKYGPPPYVLRSTAMHGQSHIDIKTNEYQLTLNKAVGSMTDLKISRKMYPQGFNISVGTDTVKAELLPQNSEVVRITVQSDGPDSVTLRIAKQTSKTNQITLNGKNNIPVATSVPPIITTPKTNGVVNGVHVNGSGSVPRNTIKRNRKLTHARSIATIPQVLVKAEVQAPENVAQPLPVAENRVQEEPMQDAKTDLQNATPVPTAATSVPPNSTPVESTPVDSTPVDSTPVDSTPVDSTPVDSTPINSTLTSNDMIIISDGLRFNRPQVVLMFAAMLFAYYAGKMSGCLVS